ncbi:hypothetical protein EPIR_2942 [Erwinia piriflorinigrans CFBP 5888]|uniref:Uncharacterized protein n=1 Tax=Erwinia piriflorinigrans CFBP 5888 TaxID=1161919 RepID=V5ZAL6_9GAMM|nr:hypothetical protein EPIR_2942 [Erwinia piriflorinigrans CFBP 5888]
MYCFLRIFQRDRFVIKTMPRQKNGQPFWTSTIFGFIC